MIHTAENDLGEVVVIADMEAGLEHLSWAGGTLRHVDMLLIVVEPYVKSLVTATRTHALAAQLSIPRVALIANRVDSDDEDIDAFAAAEDIEIIARIREDPDVRRAERAGRCVLDHAPDCAAVREIDKLSRELEGRLIPAGR
ncbi:MAG TPA: hypothetical protein VM784_05040 [Actinomycetota bacterium]|nr:hypothetical protein [Actinomycetota bacterium]